jgi:uncharacterized membrane-anchored protein
MKRKNQSGQFVLESILLMVVLMGLLAAVTAYFDQNGVISSMVKGPWTNLAGLIQNGVWKPIAAGEQQHPSMDLRHVSIQGEKVN